MTRFRSVTVASFLLLLAWTAGPVALGQTATAAQVRERRAEAEAEKLRAQREQYEADLFKALPELDRMIASADVADHRTALAALNAAAKKFAAPGTGTATSGGGGPHPFVQARLGQLANRENRPQKALE